MSLRAPWVAALSTSGLSDACACAQGTEDAKDSAAHTRLASEDFEHVELAAAVAEAVRKFNAEAARFFGAASMFGPHVAHSKPCA